MATIEQLSQRDPFSYLSCTENGMIKKIPISTYLIESVQSFFGGTNYSDQKLVAFHTLQLLKNTESSTLQQQLDKVIQLAKNASLIPDRQSIHPQTIDELTQKIASHILPRHQLPPPVSFQELSYLYGKKLESLNLLEKTKNSASEEILTIKQVPWNWTRIALVSLLMLASIPASIAIYNALHPDPIGSIPIDPRYDMPKDLHDYLKTECIRNVGNIMLQNPEELLQDGSKLWKTSVSIDSQPQCVITVKHRDCESIQDRYVNSNHSENLYRNWVYYGDIFRKFTTEEIDLPMIQWMSRQLPDSTWTKNGSLGFITRVDCVGPNSELYADGDDWIS